MHGHYVFPLALTLSAIPAIATRAPQSTPDPAIAVLKGDGHLPYQKVTALPASSAETFLGALASEHPPAYRARAALALGYLANAAYTQRLIESVKTPTASDASDLHEPYLALAPALGFLANSGSAQAATHLLEIASALPSEEDDAPAVEAESHGYRQLLRRAVGVGLAWANTEASRAALNPTTGSTPSEWQYARALSQLVQSRGLAASARLLDDAHALLEGAFVHGVPYDAVQSAGVDAQFVFVDALRRREADATWPNAVVCLGFMNDAAAGDTLLEFVRADRGAVGPVELRALLLAIPALGHSARHGNRDALSFITRYADGSGPELPFHHGPYKGARQVAAIQKLAIQALGFAASAEATSTLNRIERDPKTPAHLSDNLEHAKTIASRLQRLPAREVIGGAR